MTRMGLFDKIRGRLKGADIDTLKKQAAGMKGQVDGLVEQYGDKLPDSVTNSYAKVSEKVDGVLPTDAADTAAADGAATADADRDVEVNLDGKPTAGNARPSAGAGESGSNPTPDSGRAPDVD